MTANEIKGIGFYWCSHNLCWHVPEGKRYPVEWGVVQFDGECFWMHGGEFPTYVPGVPDYVDFIGPLEPPA